MRLYNSSNLQCLLFSAVAAANCKISPHSVSPESVAPSTRSAPQGVSRELMQDFMHSVGTQLLHYTEQECPGVQTAKPEFVTATYNNARFVLGHWPRKNPFLKRDTSYKQKEQNNPLLTCFDRVIDRHADAIVDQAMQIFGLETLSSLMPLPANPLAAQELKFGLRLSAYLAPAADVACLVESSASELTAEGAVIPRRCQQWDIPLPSSLERFSLAFEHYQAKIERAFTDSCLDQVPQKTKNIAIKIALSGELHQPHTEVEIEADELPATAVACAREVLGRIPLWPASELVLDSSEIKGALSFYYSIDDKEDGLPYVQKAFRTYSFTLGTYVLFNENNAIIR